MTHTRPVPGPTAGTERPQLASQALSYKAGVAGISASRRRRASQRAAGYERAWAAGSFWKTTAASGAQAPRDAGRGRANERRADDHAGVVYFCWPAGDAETVLGLQRTGAASRADPQPVPPPCGYAAGVCNVATSCVHRAFGPSPAGGCLRYLL